MILERLKSIVTIRNLYLFSLILIATGLSVSKPLIILGEICLTALWFFTGNFKEKLTKFSKNRMAIVLSSLFFISLIGLINTSDFEYAFGDLRRKLHLFLLPFFLSSFPQLTLKESKMLFKTFLFWVVFSSIWSLIIMFGFSNEQILDKRQLSRFHSHIRFGLEVCLAIFGSLYFFIKNRREKYSIIWVFVAIWLLGFLFLMGMFTGIVVFVITSIVLLLIYSLTLKNRIIKYGSLMLVISLVTFSVFYVGSSISDYTQSENVDPLPVLTSTVTGEKYAHDTTSVRRFDKENGYLIWKNIAWGEIKKEWNKKSTLDFDALDLKGQKLTTTLIRFLSSKGEVKNAKAIKKLSLEEIEAIEKGISNVNYLSENAVSRRLHKIIWEFDNYSQGRDYNGHSVIMRWEYLKTAIEIIKDNFVIGVGTGDVEQVFKHQYQKNESLLLPKYQLRAHNQFITYTITFGIIGGSWFLIVLLYPIIKFKEYKNYLYIAFFCISFLSMLNEDTLETLVGIVFFGFFNSIFLLQETKN